MIGSRVHFVYLRNPFLRALEEEFAAGITAKLPGWNASSFESKPLRGAVNVTFFIYRRAHVMMSHGLGDKNYLLRPAADGGLEINKYRIVLVPGPWLKRKLLAVPELELHPDDIRIVGWPRIDRLRECARSPGWTERVRRALRPLTKTKLLWAPTLADPEGSGPPLSSFPRLLPYENRLRKLFDYRTSLHPSLRGGGVPTFEALLEADILIADGGTLAYEAWALGKPVIFPSWLIGVGNRERNRGSAENYIFHQRIGLHAQSFDELVDMARTAKTPGNEVRTFMQEYLSPPAGGRSYELIANAVREVWDLGDLRIKRRVKHPSRRRNPQPAAPRALSVGREALDNVISSTPPVT